MEDNAKLYNENERFKSHIGVLTEQNSRVIKQYKQQLSDEIEIIQDQDDKIRMNINRKDRINNLLRNSKGVLERSTTNMEDVLRVSTRLNASVERESIASPNYSNNRSKIN